jgi:hypothetical protein
MFARIFIATLLAPLAVLAAGVTAHDLRCNIDTNGNGTVTSTVIRGYVEEILVDVPGTSQTGTVSVTADPVISTIAAISLATNVVTADYIVRPVVSSTDGTGSALTSPAPKRPLLWGETVTFAVSAASTTGTTWRCIVKVNEEN